MRILTRARRAVVALVAAVSLATIGVAVRWRVDPHGWGTHRHAINALTAMLHEHPCTPENIRWLTWELRAAHDPRSAASYLEEVVEVCKQLPSDVHKLAYDTHMALGQHEAALRDASRRILIDTGDRRAYLDRARAYLALGRVDRASSDADAAFRLGSRNEALFEEIYRRQDIMPL